MQIEKLHEKDKNQFLRFMDSIKNDFLPKRQQSKSYLDKYFTNKDYYLLVMKESNYIIGYLAFKKEYNKRVKIVGIGIDKKYRGKGLGKKIMNEAIKKIRKIKPRSIYTRTWETNLASQTVMKNAGFKFYRKSKNDRVNGESSVWFRYNPK